MRNHSPTDPELLAIWLEHRREAAFREIVARYAGLVHATARRTSGDESLAAEVSQLTFITLARKARSLTSCASLGGWLHRTAMMHAKNLLRRTQRENRKLELLDMETHSPPSGDTWKDIQPVLDDALASLSDKDREALLLRFYRSLTIREIAATLGIATGAAQKRIDRATERLRGKLIRRGVQTSGTLSAALLAGFAADAQAVVLPASIIASKAIAAGAASTISSSAIITLTTLMKTSTWITPAVVLLVAGALITTQRRSISKLEEETTGLQKQIVAIDSTPAKPRPVTQPTKANDSINWNEFVSKMEESRQGGRFRSENMGSMRLIEVRLQSMTKEELSAELEKTAALDLSPPYPDLIKGMIMTPLITKAPEIGLNKFMESLSDDSDNWWEPNEALKQWAIKDPGQATAWLDSQIAAGKFETKSLDGKNQLRILFEKTLIGVLLTADPVAASNRLQSLPSTHRADVLRGQPVEPENQKAFADLVRQQVPKTDQTPVLAELAYRSIFNQGYEAAGECLDRIQATPEERTVCIEHVATSKFQQLAWNGKITSKDVDALREWTASISPESTDLFTGKALGRAFAGGGRRTSFAELGELAVQYSRASGSDNVLVEFLKEPVNYLFNKAEVRALTGKITDEKRRKEVLDYFDAAFPTR